MIRMVSAVLIAFILGAMGMLLYAQKIADSAPNRNTNSDNSAADQEKAYQDMIAVKEATITELTEENAELAARIEALTAEAQRTEAVFEFESFGDEFSEEVPNPAGEKATEDADEDRRRWGGRNGEPPTPEEREELFDRMRGRMVDMWTREWENAAPESQARITAISDYQQELMNGRMAMRDAETDEERDALRASLEETEAVLRQTVSEEQRYRIQELSEKHDLDTPEGVDAFISETRQLMRSPIFTFGSGGWGRGGGRGRR